MCIKNCVHEKVMCDGLRVFSKLTYIYIPTKLGATACEFLVAVCEVLLQIFSVNSFKLSGTDNPKNYRGCDAVALVSVILRKNMFHLVSKFYAFLINKQ